MGLLTRLALRRRSVTVLGVILVLAAGIFTYRTLPVELFPEIEFPLVTVTTFYPSANPDAVAEEVTAPVENAIKGIDGLDSIQSISSENRSVVIVTFEFGTDMVDAENVINSNINGVRFPDGVGSPIVGRINPDTFPVLQLSVVGDRDIVEVQEILESSILPAISGVDGVFGVEVTGDVQRRALVTVDPDSDDGEGRFPVPDFAGAPREQCHISRRGDNRRRPGAADQDDQRLRVAGRVAKSGRRLPGRFRGPAGQPGLAQAEPPAPVTLGDVADVSLGAGQVTSISRTNGKRSLGVSVIKEPDANTIDVTEAVNQALKDLGDLPPDIEIVTISDDGPEIQGQINTLEREAVLGLILAVMVVFAFFMTLRPTAIRGALNTLRPTVVIGLSIPLSILTGVILLSWQGLSLNFMTLGGLAISVGRVVDDSIVVLENVYRNIQGGRERWRAALDATIEVGPAITASTLTTIVVFVPLGFIQGLVGAFFFPFALTVSFALIASLAVALTAVPVLGAYLLRPGDLPEGAGEEEDLPETDTWMQRAYTPVLRWALNHKAVTLVAAVVITAASLGLTAIIPVNLFPAGGDRFLSIDMTLRPGTSAETTLNEVGAIEERISEVSDVYITTVGSPAAAFGDSGPSGFNQSRTFVRVKEDAPADIDNVLRDDLAGVEGRAVNIVEIGQGPPQAGIEVSITGASYADISSVTLRLMEDLKTIEGVENITSDVSEARDEIIVDVDPARAATIGLSTQQIAFQVNQFLVGQTVTQVEVDGRSIDVVLAGRSDDINSVEKVSGLMIAGPLGLAPLGDIASVGIAEGPVTISRTDGARSASISGSISSDDTQAVGLEIQKKIDSLALPAGVEVTSGGVFSQIAEGFQDIFLAMAVGIVLVYLVMVASLGSLRNPFVIVTSLPLAIIGALVALAITGRSLGLPAMMGILMLIGIVVTNAIVLISFVEQLRQRGLSVYDALMRGGRIRLRPILMTAITTSIALLPLAAFVEDEGGIIGAQLATVVIGGLASSTVLTLVVVPVVYTLANQSIPDLVRRVFSRQPRVAVPQAAHGD